LELAPIDAGASKAVGPILRPEEAQWIKEAQSAAKSDNTVRTYKSQLRRWEEWCRGRNASMCPATVDAVLLHMIWMYDAGKSVNTIETRLAAISWLHQTSGYESPTWSHRVLETLHGLKKRAVAEDRTAKMKAPITFAELKSLLNAVDKADLDLIVKRRDRTMFVVCFAAAFRRSELLAMRVSDLEFTSDNGADVVVIRIPKSKTNQTGEDEFVTLSAGEDPKLCPVKLLGAWIEQQKLQPSDPVFALSVSTFVRAIKKHVKAARIRGGMSAFSGHSFRAGHITEAKLRDVPNEIIRETSRHTNDSQLARYDRRAAVKRRGSAGKLGL